MGHALRGSRRIVASRPDESRSPETVVLLLSFFFYRSALLPSVGVGAARLHSLAMSSSPRAESPPEASTITAHNPKERFFPPVCLQLSAQPWAHLSARRMGALIDCQGWGFLLVPGSWSSISDWQHYWEYGRGIKAGWPNGICPLHICSYLWIIFIFPQSRWGTWE